MKTIRNFYKKQILVKLLLTFLVALALGYSAGKVMGKQIKKTNSTEIIKST